MEEVLAPLWGEIGEVFGGHEWSIWRCWPRYIVIELLKRKEYEVPARSGQVLIAK